MAPEPMNATSRHPKVKVSLTLADPYFVAGDYISGKLEMDCKADKGLGIEVIMVELFAKQELTSRDHSATSTFIHSRRLFQGPGLPPSNAVQAHPLPGDPPLPPSYHQARRGHSTFLFRIPLPETSPSSISFGSGLATVQYEIRASVGVYWQGEKQLVTDKKHADVVEAYVEERSGSEEPEATVVGENGKIWCQGRIVGGVVVAGESACVELQVKNHSTKKNTGLSVSLSRLLHLPNIPANERQPLQITDTLTTVPFKGQEYSIPPGVEGVASLVFDVPRNAKTVRGGMLLGDESEAIGKPGKKPRTTQGLFEVRGVVGVKLTMGIGSKDILLEIPVSFVHPAALPALPPPEQEPAYPYYAQPQQPQYPYVSPQPPYVQSPPIPLYPSAQVPYAMDAMNQPQSPYAMLPMTTGPGVAGAYIDPNQDLVWLPPPQTMSPPPHQYFSQSGQSPPQQYYFPLPHPQYASPSSPAPFVPPQRPSSAGAYTSNAYGLLSPPLPGLPPSSSSPALSNLLAPTAPVLVQQNLPPLRGNDVTEPSTREWSTNFDGPNVGHPPSDYPGGGIDGEQGTGQRASRIAQRLRTISQATGRGRSVSPVGGHRYPLRQAPETGPPALAPLDVSAALSSVSGAGDSANGTLKTPLHSPRPVLSPKHSFTRVTQVTPTATTDGHGGVVLEVGMISKSVPKSERVEELERMADEVGEKTKDLSGDLPKQEGTHESQTDVSSDVNVNKTLPGPPVPSAKERARIARARADEYFASTPDTPQATVAPSASANLELPPSPNGHIDTRSRSRSRSRTPPTPATPTLTALATPGKLKRTSYSTQAIRGNSIPSFDLGSGQHESGLDVLERKLLAEVGTRKVVEDKRVDLWSAFGVKEKDDGAYGGKTQRPSPIAIPGREVDRDPLNDSAISSLTLPDCAEMTKDWKELEPERQGEMERDRDSDEKSQKTHRGSREAGSGGRSSKTGTKSKSGSRTKDKEGKDDKDKERRSGRKKGKDRAAAAKGRVAAWLGAVEAEQPSPPAEDVITSSPAPEVGEPEPIEGMPGVVVNADSEITSQAKADASQAVDKNAKDTIEKNVVTSAAEGKSKEEPPSPCNPNPRSSGFVPIGTLKRDIYQRTLVPKDSPFASTNSPTEDAKRITDLWNMRDADNSETKADSKASDLGKNPWLSVAKKGQMPVFLSKPPNTETKYDVRSARGGRGGKVAAVAAIWASGANIPSAPITPAPAVARALKVSPKAAISVPKFLGSTSNSTSTASTASSAGAKRSGVNTRAGVTVKSASAPIPAVISSSHAKPTISSTASLARPPRPSPTKKPLTKLPPTISEIPSVMDIKPKSSGVKSGASSAVGAVNGNSASLDGGLGAGNAARNLKALTGTTTGATKSAQPPSGERMAFGQARLRDLIKKYQGQAT